MARNIFSLLGLYDFYLVDKKLVQEFFKSTQHLHSRKQFNFSCAGIGSLEIAHPHLKSNGPSLRQYKLTNLNL